MEKFTLSENFINKYKRKKAPFGFNGLGELVYMRTYSRIKEDGKKQIRWNGKTYPRMTQPPYGFDAFVVVCFGFVFDHLVHQKVLGPAQKVKITVVIKVFGIHTARMRSIKHQKRIQTLGFKGFVHISKICHIANI